jgi:glycosyltransferase involved in cell wall biosynthesis
VLLNWGVDVEAFRPPDGARAASRARLGIPDAPTMLSPRWWREPYNPEVIQDAFERVADRLPDVQLVIKHVGAQDPVLRPSPHRDRIHVIGHVPYETMADFYRAADVCVSIPSSDSSPRSVWEAMACGAPCVLSDLPWVHELITPGEQALAVPQDAGAVADSVVRVLSDSALAERLATGGRALVEEHRNEAVEMERLSSLYERLAAAPARRAGRRAFTA